MYRFLEHKQTLTSPYLIHNVHYKLLNFMPFLIISWRNVSNPLFSAFSKLDFYSGIAAVESSFQNLNKTGLQEKQEGFLFGFLIRVIPN